MGRIVNLKSKVLFLVIESILAAFLSLILFYIITFILSYQGIIKSSYLGKDINYEKLYEIKDNEELKEYLKSVGYDYSVHDNKDKKIFSRYNENDFFDFKLIKTEKNITIDSIDYNYINTDKYQIILRIPNKPEFTNFKLRKKISFNGFTYFVIVSEFILLMFILVLKFFKMIDKEFKNLQMVINTHWKTKEENNNYKSEIKEFTNTIDKVNNMRDNLGMLIENEKKQRKHLSFQIAALAHDIKTPLTIIKGNAGLLTMTNLNEKQNEFNGFVLKGVETIDEYVDIMISHTKLIYSDEYLEKLNVNELIESILDEIKGYDNKEIEFIYTKEDIPKNIICQSVKLKRALINILVNAYDHASSIIKLTLFTKEDNICFSIWNNGSYFQDESLEKIGSAFYMGKKNRDVGKHYGLGLYFVNEVVKQHNGELIAQNKDGGAEIIVKIPFIFFKVLHL